MQSLRATGLVIRIHDWSETSRIATLWTLEHGKIRVLAKGGRRLRSSFDVALDLMNLCSIVYLRKTSGGLDLLTEARLEERFPALRMDLEALYAAYYLAELLDEGTQEYDPHTDLWGVALSTLRQLGQPQSNTSEEIIRFEINWLQSLGLSPQLKNCLSCASIAFEKGVDLAWYHSPSLGGICCGNCIGQTYDARRMTSTAWAWLDASASQNERMSDSVRIELRQFFSQTISFVLGKRPKLLNYLE